METIEATATAAELTQKAAAMGHPELEFEYFADARQPAYRYNELTGKGEHQVVRQTEYVAYDIAYGIFAVISSKPDVLPHFFSVVYAANTSDTNGVAYETLSEALRYMEGLTATE